MSAIDDAILRVDVKALGDEMLFFQADHRPVSDEELVARLMLRVDVASAKAFDAGDEEARSHRRDEFADLLMALDPEDMRSVLLNTMDLYTGLWEVAVAGLGLEGIRVAAGGAGYCLPLPEGVVGG